MNEHEVITRLKERFAAEDGQAFIPLIRGSKPFRAELSEDGIYVDNLRNQPFLPWAVFVEAFELMKKMGGRAIKGDAMQHRLGTQGLPIDSIEGHIAYTVYGKKAGDSIFRRITPLACILIWAGICVNERGYLVLRT